MEDYDEILQDLDDGMSIRAVGRKFSIPESTLRYRLKKAGLTKDEITPEEVLVGTSTLTDEDGEVKLKWTKTKVKDTENLETFKQAVTDFLMEGAVKADNVVEKPLKSDKDTMSVYTIGDAHIGMLSWKPETGADNDLETIQEDLLGAMDLLLEQSHSSKEAFIIDVGDWFHADNQTNTTAHSGNALDVDGRYPKVLQIGFMLAIKMIDKALSKHETVRWRSAIGNHNEHSAIMMTAFIKAWYRNEKRVIVHDTPSMFMYHKFGRNLIGVTHGHTAKAEKLGEIMSVDCKDIWSETDQRYWYTGHIHHQSVKEFSNCVVETFRTIAGKDAWHSASGYRSGQDMKCITLHKTYGEISRNTVSLAMVRNK